MHCTWCDLDYTDGKHTVEQCLHAVRWRLGERAAALSRAEGQNQRLRESVGDLGKRVTRLEGLVRRRLPATP